MSSKQSYFSRFLSKKTGDRRHQSEWPQQNKPQIHSLKAMLFPEPWTGSDVSFWWIPRCKGLCSPLSLAPPQSKGVHEMGHWQLLRALEVKGFTMGWHKWSKPASCSRPPSPIKTSPDLHWHKPIRFLMLWMVLAHMTCLGEICCQTRGNPGSALFLPRAELALCRDCRGTKTGKSQLVARDTAWRLAVGRMPSKVHQESWRVMTL